MNIAVDLGCIAANKRINNEIIVPNMLILTHGTNATNTNVFQSVESAGKSVVALQDFWSME